MDTESPSRIARRAEVVGGTRFGAVTADQAAALGSGTPSLAAHFSSSGMIVGCNAIPVRSCCARNELAVSPGMRTALVPARGLLLRQASARPPRTRASATPRQAIPRSTVPKPFTQVQVDRRLAHRHSASKDPCERAYRGRASCSERAASL